MKVNFVYCLFRIPGCLPIVHNLVPTFSYNLSLTPFPLLTKCYKFCLLFCVFGNTLCFCNISPVPIAVYFSPTHFPWVVVEKMGWLILESQQPMPYFQGLECCICFFRKNCAGEGHASLDSYSILFTRETD